MKILPLIPIHLPQSTASFPLFLPSLNSSRFSFLFYCVMMAGSGSVAGIRLPDALEDVAQWLRYIEDVRADASGRPAPTGAAVCSSHPAAAAAVVPSAEGGKIDDATAVVVAAAVLAAYRKALSAVPYSYKLWRALLSEKERDLRHAVHLSIGATAAKRRITPDTLQEGADATAEDRVRPAGGGRRKSTNKKPLSPAASSRTTTTTIVDDDADYVPRAAAAFSSRSERPLAAALPAPPVVDEGVGTDVATVASTPEYGEAVTALLALHGEAIARLPFMPVLHVARIHACLSHGRYEEALTAFDHAIATLPVTQHAGHLWGHSSQRGGGAAATDLAVAAPYDRLMQTAELDRTTRMALARKRLVFFSSGSTVLLFKQRDRLAAHLEYVSTLHHTLGASITAVQHLATHVMPRFSQARSDPVVWDVVYDICKATVTSELLTTTSSSSSSTTSIGNNNETDRKKTLSLRDYLETLLPLAMRGAVDRELEWPKWLSLWIAVTCHLGHFGAARMALRRFLTGGGTAPPSSTPSVVWIDRMLLDLPRDLTASPTLFHGMWLTYQRFELDCVMECLRLEGRTTTNDEEPHVEQQVVHRHAARGQEHSDLLNDRNAAAVRIVFAGTSVVEADRSVPKSSVASSSSLNEKLLGYLDHLVHREYPLLLASLRSAADPFNVRKRFEMCLLRYVSRPGVRTDAVGGTEEEEEERMPMDNRDDDAAAALPSWPIPFVALKQRCMAQDAEVRRLPNPAGDHENDDKKAATWRQDEDARYLPFRSYALRCVLAFAIEVSESSRQVSGDEGSVLQQGSDSDDDDGASHANDALARKARSAAELGTKRPRTTRQPRSSTKRVMRRPSADQQLLEFATAFAIMIDHVVVVHPDQDDASTGAPHAQRAKTKETPPPPPAADRTWGLRASSSQFLMQCGVVLTRLSLEVDLPQTMKALAREWASRGWPHVNNSPNDALNRASTMALTASAPPPVIPPPSLLDVLNGRTAAAARRADPNVALQATTSAVDEPPASIVMTTTTLSDATWFPFRRRLATLGVHLCCLAVERDITRRHGRLSPTADGDDGNDRRSDDDDEVGGTVRLFAKNGRKDPTRKGGTTQPPSLLHAVKAAATIALEVRDRLTDAASQMREQLRQAALLKHRHPPHHDAPSQHRGKNEFAAAARPTPPEEEEEEEAQRPKGGEGSVLHASSPLSLMAAISLLQRELRDLSRLHARPWALYVDALLSINRHDAAYVTAIECVKNGSASLRVILSTATQLYDWGRFEDAMFLLDVTLTRVDHCMQVMPSSSLPSGAATHTASSSKPHGGSITQAASTAQRWRMVAGRRGTSSRADVSAARAGAAAMIPSRVVDEAWLRLVHMFCGRYFTDLTQQSVSGRGRGGGSDENVGEKFDAGCDSNHHAAENERPPIERFRDVCDRALVAITDPTCRIDLAWMIVLVESTYGLAGNCVTALDTWLSSVFDIGVRSYFTTNGGRRNDGVDERTDGSNDLRISSPAAATTTFSSPTTWWAAQTSEVNVFDPFDHHGPPSHGQPQPEATAPAMASTTTTPAAAALDGMASDLKIPAHDQPLPPRGPAAALLVNPADELLLAAPDDVALPVAPELLLPAVPTQPHSMMGLLASSSNAAALPFSTALTNPLTSGGTTEPNAHPSDVAVAAALTLQRLRSTPSTLIQRAFLVYCENVAKQFGRAAVCDLANKHLASIKVPTGKALANLLSQRAAEMSAYQTLVTAYEQALREFEAQQTVFLAESRVRRSSARTMHSNHPHQRPTPPKAPPPQPPLEPELQLVQDLLRCGLHLIRIEASLNRAPRARAMFQQLSSYEHPAADMSGLWSAWRVFEAEHGSLDTFEDMERRKRSSIIAMEKVEVIFEKTTVHQFYRGMGGGAAQGSDAAGLIGGASAPLIRGDGLGGGWGGRGGGAGRGGNGGRGFGFGFGGRGGGGGRGGSHFFTL